MALDNLDEVIDVIKKAPSNTSAALRKGTKPGTSCFAHTFFLYIYGTTKVSKASSSLLVFLYGHGLGEILLAMVTLFMLYQ